MNIRKKEHIFMNSEASRNGCLFFSPKGVKNFTSSEVFI